MKCFFNTLLPCAFTYVCVNRDERSLIHSFIGDSESLINSCTYLSSKLIKCCVRIYFLLHLWRYYYTFKDSESKIWSYFTIWSLKTLTSSYVLWQWSYWHIMTYWIFAVHVHCFKFLSESFRILGIFCILRYVEVLNVHCMTLPVDVLTICRCNFLFVFFSLNRKS